MEYPNRWRLRDHRYLWNPKFTSRQELSYRTEDFPLSQSPQCSVVQGFLDGQRSSLDPPQYEYAALRSFLEKANETDLFSRPPSVPFRPIAFVDDRRDPTGWKDITGRHRAARDWVGYERYPPEGISHNSEVFDTPGLYLKLQASRNSMQAERRVIYTPDMTSLCALAIASATPELQAPVLREFMQSYVVRRSSFGVSMVMKALSIVTRFAMEFHIPYYALRKSQCPLDDPRKLRKWGRLPESISSRSEPEYLYEAQISVMVMGFDEWFWTAYCCVDTYFGSEKSIEHYHEQGLDALSGGERRIYYPMWNPRQYFLYILSLRFRQATKEWAVVVNTLEARLQTYEAAIFETAGKKPDLMSLIDDAQLTRTKDYTATLELLRLFLNALAKIIESWERFENGEMQYFMVEKHETFKQVWQEFLVNIERNMNELRALRTTLWQKTETFDNLRNGLVNASAMFETRLATEQGSYIRRLTRVTVAYLPLNLGTAIFSMAIIPREASFASYAIVLVAFTTVTLTLTFCPDSIKAMAAIGFEQGRKALYTAF